jgi:hypothetical protein
LRWLAAGMLYRSGWNPSIGISVRLMTIWLLSVRITSNRCCGRFSTGEIQGRSTAIRWGGACSQVSSPRSRGGQPGRRHFTVLGCLRGGLIRFRLCTLWLRALSGCFRRASAPTTETELPSQRYTSRWGSYVCCGRGLHRRCSLLIH